MRRLVFIDDDEEELVSFDELVRGKYTCTTFLWPTQDDALRRCPPPDIYVSDLYLPPRKGDDKPTKKQKTEVKRLAEDVGNQFLRLREHPSLCTKHGLQETMRAITSARKLLDRQWQSLGQSPENGIKLFRALRKRYRNVPFVFYSRKITPKDVTDVLRAGADDAIQKGVLSNKEVLAWLASVRKSDARLTRTRSETE